MNKEITFKAKVIKNRYNSEDFKIYVVDVDDNIYKNIKTNKNKEYIIVGNTPNLIPDIVTLCDSDKILSFIFLINFFPSIDIS